MQCLKVWNFSDLSWIKTERLGKFSLLAQFIDWITVSKTLLDMDVTWSYILINRFQNLLSCPLSFDANNTMKCMKVQISRFRRIKQ